MATITTRLATTDDIESAATVVGLDWRNFPQADWLISSELLRARMLAATSAIWVEHALSHGHVTIIDDRAAVAVWFDRAEGPLPLPGDYDGRLDTECGVHADRFRRFDAFAEAHHPVFPHHHLAILAVAPGHPDYLADVLLRQHHAQLDSARLPAVIRAYSPEQVTRYEQHGYRVLERYSPDENSPMLWSMCREPLV